ncbi:hypothetical protein T4B_12840 [Trichinella pseudospiralis]|uniref:Uncharacterized protein n=1 Tax=Trichinella pseudospiralis TaxID=6337 RepID=A0A0V1IBL9_TRIPS|nr:hypothetical protein T4B_12840 [Trichinella pseudospiralis]
MQPRDNGNWSGGVPQPFQRFSANHNEYGVAALPPSKFELSARYRINMIYEVSIDATLCWLKLPLKLVQSSQCGLLLITKNTKLLI